MSQTAPAPARASAPTPTPGSPSASASPSRSAPAVEAVGLSRRFDDVVAVRGVDLSVAPGTILGIIGPSGSGKTTTIKMLIGTLVPTEGSVTVLGERPTQFRRATRERLGYMPQHSILYPDLTVGENVDFAASLFGLLYFRRRKRKRQVLELLDLWSVRKRRAGKLSGGMQRRLSLACALVHEPAVLVLDEPTAGLDPILRRVVWDELQRLRDRGVTVLSTTQYVTEAEECDDVALIAGGRVVALGAPDALRKQAMGGEEIELATDKTFDADSLRSLPSVRSIHQTSLREARVTVDDAGAATPEIVDAVTSTGAQVVSVRESRPSFEDVFTRLVEQDTGTPDPEVETPAPEILPGRERPEPTEEDAPPPQRAPGDDDTETPAEASDDRA